MALVQGLGPVALGQDSIVWILVKRKRDVAFKGDTVSSKKVQFSSIAQSCPTLCYPMDCSTSGLPVHHQLLGLTQTHVHRVGDAIQPSLPLSHCQPFPASGSFPVSQFFTLGVQSIGVSGSAPVLP